MELQSYHDLWYRHPMYPVVQAMLAASSVIEVPISPEGLRPSLKDRADCLFAGAFGPDGDVRGVVQGVDEVPVGKKLRCLQSSKACLEKMPGMQDQHLPVNSCNEEERPE